jgi:hypothetical protein
MQLTRSAQKRLGFQPLNLRCDQLLVSKFWFLRIQLVPLQRGMGGYLGTILLGVFADKDVNGVQGSGGAEYTLNPVDPEPSTCAIPSTTTVTSQS